jgi:integrase
VSFYRQKLGHTARFYGEHGRMVEITPDSVDAFVAMRSEEGAHQSTISHELTCLVQMCKLARRAGEFAGDISALRPVGYTADYNPRERWLTFDEVEALRSKLPPRRFAVVAASIATSARYSELWRIRPSDWDPTSAVVRIHGSKTDDSARLVPIISLFADLWDAALPYLPLHWPHVTQDLPAICLGLGFERATPNDLRRTCASWMAQRGVPLELARRIMGHKGETMLRKVYARMTATQLGALIESHLVRTDPSQFTRREHCSCAPSRGEKCQ